MPFAAGTLTELTPTRHAQKLLEPQQNSADESNRLTVLQQTRSLRKEWYVTADVPLLRWWIRRDGRSFAGCKLPAT